MIVGHQIDKGLKLFTRALSQITVGLDAIGVRRGAIAMQRADLAIEDNLLHAREDKATQVHKNITKLLGG